MALCASPEMYSRPLLRPYRDVLRTLEAELHPTESQVIEDIPFSDDLREDLADAYRRAQKYGHNLLSEEQILYAVLRRSPEYNPKPKVGEWRVALQREGARLSWFLSDDNFCQLLRGAGVDLVLLRSQVDDVEILELEPPIDFWRTAEGHRLSELKFAAGDNVFARFLLKILAGLLGGAPAAEPLARGGLNEGVILQILERLPRPRPPDPTGVLAALNAGCPPVDLKASLGEGGYSRLTVNARHCLRWAWNISDGVETSASNLLLSLLMLAAPLEPTTGSTRILRSLRAFAALCAGTPMEIGNLYRPKSATAVLSGPVYRALAVAFRAAEPEPAGTEHLLLGLAEIGLAELVAEDLTVDRIRVEF